VTKTFSLFGRSSSLLLLIFYKLLLAIVQIIAGTLFLTVAFFIKHPVIIKAISDIADKDRLDIFINWVVGQIISWQIEYEVVLHIGLVLIALGIFSAIIAGGLWFKSTKMRLLALLVFGALALYSLYQLFLDFSIFKTLTLTADFFIIYYFWKILPKHLER
jgi:uncharacterized membrane protein